MFTLPSGMHIRPSLAPHSANQNTSHFCCCLPIGRNSNVTDWRLGPFSGGPTNRTQLYGTASALRSGVCSRTTSTNTWTPSSATSANASMTSYRGLLYEHSQTRIPGLMVTNAYNSGDLEECKKSRYGLRSAISSAKRQYRDKVD